MPRGKRLDPRILEAALVGLEAQRQRTDEQIVQVRALLGGDRSSSRAERTTVVLEKPDLVDKVGVAPLASILARSRILSLVCVPFGVIPQPCSAPD